jgi:hypothetical protein
MPKLVCLLAFALVIRADEPVEPLSIYKSGNYVRAIPLLQQAVAKNPKDAPMQAALLSALVYQGRVDDAADAAEDDAQNFPESPDVLAARGDFAFYMGDMPAAENLYKAALKLKEETARGYYGLYRVYHAASLYRSARLLCLRAHSLDPDDALITAAFLRYLASEKRREDLPAFIQSHPWFYGDFSRRQETGFALQGELEARRPFQPDGQMQEATLPLFYLHNGPRITGVAVQMSIEGRKPLKLLLDTGASGVLLSQFAIDKAGLNHVGSFDVRGIGDKGARSAFLSIAETCSIGTVKFKTCIFQATEGKRGVMDDEDGLLGPDVFADYLITIDFQRRTLHLVPLPERPPNPQGYDRTPLASESGYTPIFRFGHALFVSTKVNGKSTGLFVLDTGSETSFMDSTFARLSTKIHGNEYMHVKGLSGSVNQVFEADKAELQFARFRQSNLGLTSINLNNNGEHQDVRMDGVLGLPVLTLFRLSLDYRNGLVNFDYVLERK